MTSIPEPGEAESPLQERLTRIAGLINPCPPPDMLGGFDSCSHGSWPCASTEAAWLAQGRNREQEVGAACQAVARAAAVEDAGREVMEEYAAARREGRPPYWETELAELAAERAEREAAE